MLHLTFSLLLRRVSLEVLGEGLRLPSINNQRALITKCNQWQFLSNKLIITCIAPRRNNMQLKCMDRSIPRDAVIRATWQHIGRKVRRLPPPRHQSNFDPDITQLHVYWSRIHLLWVSERRDLVFSWQPLLSHIRWPSLLRHNITR